MKNKIGFNIFFALVSFILGMALLREFDFQNFVFRKQFLGFLYPIVFIISVFLTFKKKDKESEKQKIGTRSKRKRVCEAEKLWFVRFNRNYFYVLTKVVIK
ncbi:hypothetical protein [Pedobacter alpinus]|uniref:Integral membrane protein n=1 Tax=Pedobacter alpinus TaxID=1590643 RepID=A0ABW5TS84_9SPHI